jgi:hypothetical protein
MQLYMTKSSWISSKFKANFAKFEEFANSETMAEHQHKLVIIQRRKELFP